MWTDGANRYHPLPTEAQSALRREPEHRLRAQVPVEVGDEVAEPRLVDPLPKALFLVPLVALGLYVPAPIDALFHEVAAALGGR